MAKLSQTKDSEMPSMKKEFQKLYRQYMREKKTDRVELEKCAEWIIDANRWKPTKATLIRQCVGLIGQAMREDYFIDPQGRRIRAMHARTIKRKDKQLSLWGDIRKMPRRHMAVSFNQRRKRIFADCRQLNNDADSYNENYNDGKPIQLSFNFTKDLIEDKLGRENLAKNPSKSQNTSLDPLDVRTSI